MSQDPVAHYLSQYASRPAAAQAAWLVQQQDQAVESLRRNGFPTRRNEEWKYTDVQPLLKRDFNLPAIAAVTDATIQTQAQIEGLDCYRMLFVNGRLHSADTINGQGVVIRSLRDALAADDQLLKPHLNRYLTPGNSSFTDLNTALLSDGCVILLADNAVLDKPLHLVFLADPKAGAFACHPRNLFVLGKQAEATVIETYTGSDATDYFTNTQVEQQRNSRLVSHSISLGGKLVRNDIDVRLNGAGAETVLNGLYITAGSQHVDNHTRVDHLVPHTRSVETYRGVLAGRSRAVFNGKVVVHKDAQKTDAQQSNANLLLSSEAEIDTKPELQIHADDVKCSHGATVGQLDQNMLYYLRTRAIPEDLARSLLTFAFAGDVIRRMALAPVRQWLQQRVVGQLPDADTIREFVR